MVATSSEVEGRDGVRRVCPRLRVGTARQRRHKPVIVAQLRGLEQLVLQRHVHHLPRPTLRRGYQATSIPMDPPTRLRRTTTRHTMPPQVPLRLWHRPPHLAAPPAQHRLSAERGGVGRTQAKVPDTSCEILSLALVQQCRRFGPSHH